MADVRRALGHGTAASLVQQLRVANLVETWLKPSFHGGHLQRDLVKKYEVPLRRRGGLKRHWPE